MGATPARSGFLRLKGEGRTDCRNLGSNAFSRLCNGRIAIGLTIANQAGKWGGRSRSNSLVAFEPFSRCCAKQPWPLRLRLPNTAGVGLSRAWTAIPRSSEGTAQAIDVRRGGHFAFSQRSAQPRPQCARHFESDLLPTPERSRHRGWSGGRQSATSHNDGVLAERGVSVWAVPALMAAVGLASRAAFSWLWK